MTEAEEGIANLERALAAVQPGLPASQGAEFVDPEQRATIIRLLSERIAELKKEATPR